MKTAMMSTMVGQAAKTMRMARLMAMMVAIPTVLWTVDPKDDTNDKLGHLGDQTSAGRKRCADKRYRKRGPIPGGTGGKALKKLSQHIQYAHQNTSADERKRIVKGQKRVAKVDAYNTIIAVKWHKTSTKGPANLMIAESQLEELMSYVNTVRPLLDPDNACPFVFVRDGPKQVTQISNRIKSLGSKFGVQAPTATRARKIGSTITAVECGTSVEARLIANQKSHSAEVHAKHYQHVGSTSHASHMRKDKGKYTKEEILT